MIIFSSENTSGSLTFWDCWACSWSGWAVSAGLAAEGIGGEHGASG